MPSRVCICKCIITTTILKHYSSIKILKNVRKKCSLSQNTKTTPSYTIKEIIKLLTFLKTLSSAGVLGVPVAEFPLPPDIGVALLPERLREFGVEKVPFRTP